MGGAVFFGHSTVGEGGVDGLAEGGAAADGTEEMEVFGVEAAIVDGVVMAMDGEEDRFAGQSAHSAGAARGEPCGGVVAG